MVRNDHMLEMARHSRGHRAVAALIVGMLPSLLNGMTGLAPRWPTPYGASLLAGMMGALLLLIGSEAGMTRIWTRPHWRRGGSNKAKLGTTAASLILLTLYFALDALFCYSAPPEREFRERVARGLTFREGTLDVISGYEVRPSHVQLLKDTEWDPTLIWSAWSISFVRGMLLLNWLLAWLSVALVCACWLVRESPEESDAPSATTSQADENENAFSRGEHPVASTVQVKGQQYQKLVEALTDAFPDPQRLAMMLQFRLEKNLALVVALNNPLDLIAFELIKTANAEGWTGPLIAAARESVPSNPRLVRFAEDFGLCSAKPELEQRVREDLAFIDIVKWRKRLGEIEGQVCRVEIPVDSGVGTGFLLGPDVLMTNYHVMESVLKGRRRPDDVVLRFDYKRLDDGTTLNRGLEFRLVPENWLIDSSPYSAVDRKDDPGNEVPGETELDYVLLRVAGEPGYQPVGGDRAEPGAPPRRWVEPSTVPFVFEADAPLFIVQHPEGGPLKLALDTRAVLGVNANGTRVRYRTNTEPGSSGSPVFNVDWELVALHHSGDRSLVPRFNQGISFGCILQLLKLRGHKNTLGSRD